MIYTVENVNGKSVSMNTTRGGGYQQKHCRKCELLSMMMVNNSNNNNTVENVNGMCVHEYHQCLKLLVTIFRNLVKSRNIVKI